MDHPVTNLIEVEGFVIASATDVGRHRTGNEDSHALWIGEDAAVRAKQGMLLVVCDGMGGASAGEVASQLAVQTVVERVRTLDSAGPEVALRDAVEAANAAVHAQATANNEQRGMGTTCTAVILRGRELWVGHVGDSRAYLVRGGKLQRLTQDHSLVAELIAKGHLTEAKAKHDPRRNVVTRSVGALDHVEVDVERAVEKLQPGDVLVMCSDGLHGQVTDAEIVRIAGGMPPAEACAALIDLANEHGGPDNITAIVARLGPMPATAPARAAGAKESGRKLPPHLGMLVGATVVLALLVVGVGAALFGQLKKPAANTVATDAPAAVAVHPDPATGSAATATTPVPVPETARPEKPAVSETPPEPSTPTPRAARPVTRAPQSVPVEPPPTATGAGENSTSRPGTVRLMTRPFQPSTFSVDGQPYAQDVGFLTQSLPAGDHVVHVEGAAGAAVDVPVHVEPGGSYSLVAELPTQGALGSIEIALAGGGRAQVLVDGAQYPETAPCVVRGLAPGPHTIRVLRPKHPPAQGPGEVTVTSGGTAHAEYRFGAGR